VCSCGDVQPVLPIRIGLGEMGVFEYDDISLHAGVDFTAHDDNGWLVESLHL
jgi:hypothetical protein